MKKNIIRIGDRVKIINPEFFVRCGYPLSLKDASEIIRNECSGRISAFIKDIGLTPVNDINNDRFLTTFNKIVSALAYDYIKDNKFGGNERKIYTSLNSIYKDKPMEVYNIKFVKTGIYIPAKNSYTYEYGIDYEPPYLANQKSHKILSLRSYDLEFFYDSHMIETTNVEML